MAGVGSSNGFHLLKKGGLTFTYYSLHNRDIYSGHFDHFPPPWGEFLSKLKHREELEGGLEKRKGKGG